MQENTFVIVDDPSNRVSHQTLWFPTIIRAIYGLEVTGQAVNKTEYLPGHVQNSICVTIGEMPVKQPVENVVTIKNSGDRVDLLPELEVMGNLVRCNFDRIEKTEKFSPYLRFILQRKAPVLD